MAGQDKDEDIDLSDIPEASAEWFRNAKLVPKTWVVMPRDLTPEMFRRIQYFHEQDRQWSVGALWEDLIALAPKGLDEVGKKKARLNPYLEEGGCEAPTPKPSTQPPNRLTRWVKRFSWITRNRED